jgi:FkbM family methyltransferase
LRVSELAHPIRLRPHTSDLAVFWQIFCRGDYDFALPIEPCTVIDGGANVGCFSVLMANRYPAARILAVEPAASNFALLRRNTAAYPNIHAVHCGLWNRDTRLAVVDVGLGEWGLQVTEAAAEEPRAIQSISIGGLMAQHGLSKIDLLKLDVEGAEEAIFESGYECWLPRTKVIVIELHEYVCAGSSAAFWRAIRRYPYSNTNVGGNMCLLNREFIRA